MKTLTYRIGCVPGDGSGPELMNSALDVLGALLGSSQRSGTGIALDLKMVDIGYNRWQESGDRLDQDGITWAGIARQDLEVLAGCDAILFTAVGTADFPAEVMSPYPLLRRSLDIYANVRRARALPNSGAVLPDFDITLVREQLEGLWMAPEFWIGDVACAVARASRPASARIARFAFEEAVRRQLTKVTCVHKANISRIFFGSFRDAFRQVASEFPNILLGEMHTDVLPFEMIRNPSSLQIVATTNMYGDAISGAMAGLVGGMGLLPSAEHGSRGSIFRPAHGTAPDLAGQDLVNPTATLLALQMLLEWLGAKVGSTALTTMGHRLGAAIRQIFVDQSAFTPDLGGTSGTKQMTAAVIANLK